MDEQRRPTLWQLRRGGMEDMSASLANARLLLPTAHPCGPDET